MFLLQICTKLVQEVYHHHNPFATLSLSPQKRNYLENTSLRRSEQLLCY